MKILVFGCGYVGRAAARYWKEKGHQVGGTTRKAERLEALKQELDSVHLLVGPEAIGELLQREDYEALLFSAAADSPQDYRSTYLENARLISKAPHLRFLLYTSSLSVYGDCGGSLVDETTPLSPSSPNSRLLAETEQLLLTARHTAILRLGQIIGEGRELSTFLRKRSSPWPGDGSNSCHLSPLNDIVAGLDFALEQQLEGLFNFCTDCSYTRRELYTLICKNCHLPPPEWDPTVPSMHGGNKKVSCEKIKKRGFRFEAYSPEGSSPTSHGKERSS